MTRVEQRLELYTHINISHQEDVQILRYSDGEKCAFYTIAKSVYRWRVSMRVRFRLLCLWHGYEQSPSGKHSLSVHRWPLSGFAQLLSLKCTPMDLAHITVCRLDMNRCSMAIMTMLLPPGLLVRKSCGHSCCC